MALVTLRVIALTPFLILAVDGAAYGTTQISRKSCTLQAGYYRPERIDANAIMKIPADFRQS
ncbi:hypothetical protein [Paracoccus sp. (in: a-proteobacteria)]|uniref:hypothetical protein n=1 Tax=Paracoccus sp. TaxID=267 RepID=UPI0035AEBEED